MLSMHVTGIAIAPIGVVDGTAAPARRPVITRGVLPAADGVITDVV